MKLKTGFTNYSPTDLADMGDKVTKNAVGPVWTALLALVTAVGNAVTALRNTMMSSGAGKAMAMQTGFQALAQAMTAFAKGANDTPGITDDDRATLDLPMVKTAVHSEKLAETQQDLRLKHGPVSGMIISAFKRTGDNIVIFEAQWTLDPNAGPWTDVEQFTNSRRFEITGLPRGKDIWVRVRARNSKGWGEWSDPATIMVL